MHWDTLYLSNSKLQKFPEYGQLQPFPDPPFPTQDDFFGQNQFQPIQPITPEQVQPEVQPEVQLEIQPEIQVQPEVQLEIQPEIQVQPEVQLQQAAFECDQIITGRNFAYQEGTNLYFSEYLLFA